MLYASEIILSNDLFFINFMSPCATLGYKFLGQELCFAHFCISRSIWYFNFAEETHATDMQRLVRNHALASYRNVIRTGGFTNALIFQ